MRIIICCAVDALIAIDALDLDIDRRGRIDAGQRAEIEDRRDQAAVGLQIGAEVGQCLDP